MAEEIEVYQNNNFLLISNQCSEIIISLIKKTTEKIKCTEINSGNKKKCSRNALYETNIEDHRYLCRTHVEKYIEGNVKEYLEKLEHKIIIVHKETIENFYKNEVDCEAITKQNKKQCTKWATCKTKEGKYLCTIHAKNIEVEILTVRPILQLLNEEEIKEITERNNQDKKMNKEQLKHYLILINIARNKNWEIISKSYVKSGEKMTFKCHCGKIWFPDPDDIKRGNGCPNCKKTKKLTESEVHKLAESKGYTFESKKYIDNKTKYLWGCKIHGVFEMTLYNIQRNYGCKKCSGNEKHNLEEVKILIEEKGGECFSTDYINCRTNMEFWCKNPDHKHWFTTFSEIKNKGRWCPQCAGKAKHTLDDVKVFIEARGGECFSIEYIDCETKMEFWCKNPQHPHWFTTFSHVKNDGTWCPYCNQPKGEKAIMDFLNIHNIKYKPQKIFDFLPRKEYDFYLPDLNIIIEFDGQQHFEYVKLFHKIISFDERREVDILKTKVALENDIRLVRVDYTNIDSIEMMLLEALESEEQLFLSNSRMYEWLTNAL